MGQVTSDLRWTARVPFDCVATVRFGTVEILGKIRDLSFSGCFIETLSRYEVGTPMGLAFSIDPAVQSLRTNGRIVRRTPHGVGVRFAYIDAQAPRMLKQWIESQRSAR